MDGTGDIRPPLVIDSTDLNFSQPLLSVSVLFRSPLQRKLWAPINTQETSNVAREQGHHGHRRRLASWYRQGNGKGASAQVTVFEAAMPTLVSAGIVAEQFDLRPALCNLVIGIGIVLGFLTTTLWYYIITSLIS